MFQKQRLLDKVQTLREERNMMQYCDALGLAPQMTGYIKKMITMIQYHIFAFDAVCEQHTGSVDDLEMLCETTKQDIFALVLILTHNEWSAIAYTERLFSFYAMELDMRRIATAKSIYTHPLAYSLEEFYLLKSCDVFLSRRLIGVLADVPESYTPAIELFDMVGEILDDCMDVEEDQEQINANRFLISLVHFDEEKTVYEYRSFVSRAFEELDKEFLSLTACWLDVIWLKNNLNFYLDRDWGNIQKSKTNELLFGV